MILDTSARTLSRAIIKNIRQESTVFSDDAGGYKNLKGYWHSWVQHSSDEYVRDKTTTNGIESR